MQVPITRLKDKNGFWLYRRELTKAKNTVSWPKYFIGNDSDDYFKEFRTIREANKEFETITKNTFNYGNKH